MSQGVKENPELLAAEPSSLLVEPWGVSETTSNGQRAKRGLQGLAFALLSDAISVYQGNASFKGVEYGQDRANAWAWFHSPYHFDPEHPLSFQTVCEILGLDAGAVIKRLIIGSNG